MPPLGLVYPIVPYPLRREHTYKHMAKRDHVVWERWLDKYAADYLSVSYDVAVGGVVHGDFDPENKFQRAFQYETALKIDALVVGEDRVLVVEVRPWATVSALGAAVTYTMMLDAAGIISAPLVPAIVCEGIQTDVRWACDQMRVQVFEV